ncbi:hypothetical protein D3C76_1035640 [compost metagenome]
MIGIMKPLMAKLFLVSLEKYISQCSSDGSTRIMPRNRDRCAAAAARTIGPPQLCPTRMNGPEPRAVSRSPKSPAMRSRLRGAESTSLRPAPALSYTTACACSAMAGATSPQFDLEAPIPDSNTTVSSPVPLDI